MPSQTVPPQLASDQDKASQTFENGQTKSREEITALVEEHLPYTAKLAWSLLRSWRIRLDPEELSSAIGMALTDAATRFDPEKGVMFRTFLFYHLRGTILKEVTRSVELNKLYSTLAHEVSAGEFAGIRVEHESNDPERATLKQELSHHLVEGCNLLDSLEREIVYRVVLQDMTVVDIADSLGYCRCHVSRLKTKAFKKLKVFLHSLEAAPEVVTSEKGGVSFQLRDRQRYTGGRGRRRTVEKKADRNTDRDTAQPNTAQPNTVASTVTPPSRNSPLALKRANGR